MSSVVAIGNFDGVHAGHRLVFAEAARLARENTLTSVALTFTPHPRTFFCPESPVRVITDDARKSELILSLGINEVYFKTFDAAFSALDCKGFVDYLIKTFSCAAAVCGADFRFGKNASYTADDLSDECRLHGITLSVIPVNKSVSSSVIRELLEKGDAKTAAELLCVPFSVCAPVDKGLRIGSSLGFPTVNQHIPPEYVLPLHGVYAGFTVTDAGVFRSVTNIGSRPTVNNNAGDVDIETFLLGFSGNLYGKTIRVFLTDYIRSEKKFDNPDLLREQINKDCRFVSEKDYSGLKYMQNQQLNPNKL